MAEELPQLPAGEVDPGNGAGPSEPAGEAKPPPKKRRRKGSGKDKAPRKQKSGAQKRSEKASTEVERIEKFFTKVLTMPAGAFMVKGDRWAFEHVANQGPELAKAIAEECQENAVIRRYCLQLVEWFSAVTIAGAVGAYLLPLLMHFGIVPGASLLGVPVVSSRKPKPAEPAAGKAPPFMGGHQAPPPPAPEPEPEPQWTGDPLADELSGADMPPPVEAI